MTLSSLEVATWRGTRSPKTHSKEHFGGIFFFKWCDLNHPSLFIQRELFPQLNPSSKDYNFSSVGITKEQRQAPKAFLTDVFAVST